ncbi:hypothetical protein Q4Q34_17165 [Flavivirga abyssicola]|uniref:DUF6970 domain-containing protein n=1 Tax=Flavivirga abyssicola TaxID=3063533 RepID=UPI0026DF73D2|nr:hypothetical protein [Flavivirga sp. MEBiC07777]WVK12945.1 hypothetical protein Q4Q34_17165 [Flavivirga sp. MEBiC07777]
MRHTFLFLCLIFFIGCSETDKAQTSKLCSDNPLENIDWLKELLNNTDSNGLEIIQYDYKGQTVFSINSCLNCADNLITVYDCKRNKVCEFGGIAGLNTCPDFETEATNKTVIFTDRYCEKGIIISPKLYKELKSSPITSAEINGNCLDITFSILSTQDRIEDVKLVDSGEVLESMPTQRRIKFYIEENLTKPTSMSATTSFDVSNLAEQGETIILNIDGFDTSIEYTRVP